MAKRPAGGGLPHPAVNDAHERREAKLIGELAGMHRKLLHAAYAHHPPHDGGAGRKRRPAKR